MNLKKEKTNIIQKKRCVLLWTHFEQLHSRHLVRSLTGSCTACGCLQEHSGLHIVTSNPFLSVQQGVKKDYLLLVLPSREEGLAYFFWPSKHVDIVGTLATVLERHHQGQHCRCKNSPLSRVPSQIARSSALPVCAFHTGGCKSSEKVAQVFDRYVNQNFVLLLNQHFHTWSTRTFFCHSTKLRKHQSSTERSVFMVVLKCR